MGQIGYLTPAHRAGTQPLALRAPRVVIVGAGLAGMAAAVALESAGASVTLIEAARRLGGRAGSFTDPQSGEELDNCQHVLLGCCTNLLDFYERIGAADLIRFEQAILFQDQAGHTHALQGSQGLPAPLHLGPSLLHFSALTLSERFSLTGAMLAMMRLGRQGRQALEGVSFGEWLDEQRQPEPLVTKLYDPILIGALNEECRKASAAYAIQVFQDSLLAHSDGYRLGLPACPLSRLYARLPCRDVRLGTRVAGVRLDASAANGVILADGTTIDADAVVLATNHHTLTKLVPGEILSGDSRLGNLDRLESVPILGAHLWFDRPVLTASHLALMEGPLQWVFRKDHAGHAVHGVISAARSWVGVPHEEALRQFTDQIQRALPGAAGATLQRGVVVVEKRATFSPLPGSDAFRPPQGPKNGDVRGLYLAGDYTRTGWPATMEGAVRGGYLAAEAILADAHHSPHSRFLRADLPLQWPARLLGAIG